MKLSYRLPIFAVTALVLTACGAAGGTSGSAAPAATQNSQLQVALDYASGPAFISDAASSPGSDSSSSPNPSGAFNYSSPQAPSAPVCSATRVQKEITFVQDVIAFLQKYAGSASWEACILDLLNLRLTDLQTLLTEVQAATPTESCYAMMATIEAGDSVPASCQALRSAPPPALSCQADTVQAWITGTQNALNALANSSSTSPWKQCATDSLNQRLTNLQALLSDVQSGPTTGGCYAILESIASGQSRPASCTPPAPPSPAPTPAS